MEAVVEQADPRDLMTTLRGSVAKVKPDRLTFTHLELRDQALDRIVAAQSAVERLEQVERGDAGEPIRSPRYDEVRQVKSELRNLGDRLDRAYV